MKRASILIGGILIATALIVSLRGFRVEKYRDENVIGGEIIRLWNIASVHSSRPKYLIVSGQQFEGIRGLPPYYLRTFQPAGIVFVTEDKKNEVAVHFWNSSEKKVSSLSIGDSVFGWNIGAGRMPGEKYTDWIQASNANDTKLITRTEDLRVETTVNFTRHHVERVETLYLDNEGHEVSRSERHKPTKAR